MTKRVFVIWDEALTQMQDYLHYAQKAAGKSGDLVIDGLGLGEPTVAGSIPSTVRERILAADHVVAVVDRANGNVGFEIGFALGSGKPVVLCVSESEPKGHPWLSRRPWEEQGIRRVRNKDDLLAACRQSEALRVTGAAVGGSGVLLVCPTEESGGDIRADLAELDRVHPVEMPASVAGLDAFLNGRDTVLWVIPALSEVGQSAAKDHPAVATDALVAGYALSRGRRLHCLLRDGIRPLLDVAGELHRWPNARELRPLVERLLGPGTPVPKAPLETYRIALEAQHRRLIPFFADAQQQVTEHCYVDVQVSDRAFGPGAEHVRGFCEAQTLRALLGGNPGGRFLIAGEPGAGKSTMLRHLCHEWATQPEGLGSPTAPVPVFVSLSRFAEARADDLLGLAVKLTPGADGEPIPHLKADLEALARAPEPGRLWLFLDGLDEVRDGQGGVIQRIGAWATAHPGVTIVVTTRPRDKCALDATFTCAEMRPLGRAEQRRLLEHWLAGWETSVDEAWRAIEAQPKLGALTGNPLMLTLIAVLVREDATSLPPTRVKLYEQAVEILLTRRHQRREALDVAPVKNVPLAKLLLSELALALHLTGGEAWGLEAEVEDAVWAFDKAKRGAYQKVRKVWDTHAHALDDIHAVSGLFGPLDGDRQRWRFLHRSFREYLAAVALKSRKNATKYLSTPPLPTEANGDESERPDGLTVAGWWGEACAFLAGMAADPIALMTALRATDTQLFGRVIQNADGLPIVPTLDFLWSLEDWDGDWLAAVVSPCATVGHPDRDAVVEWLWARVVPGIETDVAGRLHFALCMAGAAPSREQFFGVWGKALPGSAAVIAEDRFRPIPGDRFLMGSPATEEGHRPREAPQNDVAMSPFEMLATPVTNADYRAFDPRWTPDWAGDDRPATSVSHWSARLFARWHGVDLPTEAQWEYACRAGTTTRFSSGDSEADLANVGWFRGNAGREPHPVGQKPANRFGLHDMHGNVWEWCRDGRRAYSEDAQTDPVGPSYGARRAVRGGSFRSGADGGRSACRVDGGPGLAGGFLGFRLVRPAPSAPRS